MRLFTHQPEDVLTLNRQKERQERPIYTNRNIWYMYNIHTRSIKKNTQPSKQVKCAHIVLWTSKYTEIVWIFT